MRNPLRVIDELVRRFSESASGLDRRNRDGEFGKWPWQKDPGLWPWQRKRK